MSQKNRKKPFDKKSCKSIDNQPLNDIFLPCIQASDIAESLDEPSQKKLPFFKKLLVWQLVFFLLIFGSGLFIKHYSTNLYITIKDNVMTMINESVVIENIFKQLELLKEKIPQLTQNVVIPIEETTKDVADKLEENITKQENFSPETPKSPTDSEQSTSQSDTVSHLREIEAQNTKPKGNICSLQNKKIMEYNSIDSTISDDGKGGTGTTITKKNGIIYPEKEVCLASYKILGNVTKPVVGNISSSFGCRINPISGNEEFHPGIDIASPLGSDIFAFMQGQVEETGENKIFGKYILLRHSQNFATFYGHCDSILATKGMIVRGTERIAKVGKTGWATGPHLHFEIIISGKKVDPGAVLIDVIE